MATQNYENHGRLVPFYHVVLTGILLLTLIGGIVNLVKAVNIGTGVYSAALIVVLVVALVAVGFYARAFPLAAQDRVIRAEENLRHYMMFGRPLDSRLTMRQIIGLRFASDDELEALIERTLAENLSEKDIKKAIKNWRADEHRL